MPAPQPADLLHFLPHRLGILQHQLDAARPPGPDPAPAADQHFGVEEGEFQLDLVKLPVRGRCWRWRIVGTAEPGYIVRTPEANAIQLGNKIMLLLQYEL